MHMRITRRLFLTASAAGLCRAQDPVFTADSRVVTLLAGVRDADGRLIADLNKEDFALAEDGRPVEIRYFSRETELPLTVGLLVDTSSSQWAVLERERRGAYSFLERVLRPDRDTALVMSFDAKVKILCPPTAALSDLRKGLNAADLPLRKNVKLKPGMEPKKKDLSGGTKLQTAVLQCSDRFMLQASGRTRWSFRSFMRIQDTMGDFRSKGAGAFSRNWLARPGEGSSPLRRSAHWNRSSTRFGLNYERSTASVLSLMVGRPANTESCHCGRYEPGCPCRPVPDIIRGKRGTRIASTVIRRLRCRKKRL
jgi:hypothetical protein